MPGIITASGLPTNQLGQLPPNFASSKDFDRWAGDVLGGIGAPNTNYNKTLLLAWSQGENTNAKNNPLATTQYWNGATAFNTLQGGGHVYNYSNYQDGVSATVTTLTNGYYPGIVNDLRKGTVLPQDIVDQNAAEFGTWGTGANLVSGRLAAIGASATHAGSVVGTAEGVGKAVTDPVTKAVGTTANTVGHYIIYGLAAAGGVALLIVALALIGADIGLSVFARTKVAKSAQGTIGAVGGYRQQKQRAAVARQKQATTSARAGELHQRRIEREDRRKKLDNARVRQERAKARKEEQGVIRKPPSKPGFEPKNAREINARAQRQRVAAKKTDDIPY